MKRVKAKGHTEPLTSYYGGKSGRLGQTIADMVDQINHDIYVEPFAGMFAVLRHKKPSKVEVINDLFDGLVNLLRVIRDEGQRARLLNLLRLTPYARSEFNYCKRNWKVQTDPVEKARQLYVLLSQNFVGEVNNGSWSFGGVKCDYNVARTFYNRLEVIEEVAARLQQVQIECQPALRVMGRWSSPRTVLYLDPPYLMGSRGRSGKRYAHEMTDEQHIELLNWCLADQDAYIFLSGYPSKLYSETLEGAGWARQDYESIASSALQTDANGLKNRPVEVAKRTECLWINPKARATLEEAAARRAQTHNLFTLSGIEIEVA